MTVGKSEIIEALREKRQYYKKQSITVFDDIIEVIIEFLEQGAAVRIFGFGTFSLKAYPGRTIRIPKSNQYRTVAPFVSVRFKPTKKLLRRLRSVDAEALLALQNRDFIHGSEGEDETGDS